jgi:hypothetical protein
MIVKWDGGGAQNLVVYFISKRVHDVQCVVYERLEDRIEPA